MYCNLTSISAFVLSRYAVYRANLEDSSCRARSLSFYDYTNAMTLASPAAINLHIFIPVILFFFALRVSFYWRLLPLPSCLTLYVKLVSLRTFTRHWVMLGGLAYCDNTTWGWKLSGRANIRMNVSKTLIFPVILYGCESWSLTWRENMMWRCLGRGCYEGYLDQRRRT